MADILRDWRIQLFAVPDVAATEQRLRQAGIECSSQSGCRVTAEFRQLTPAEEAAGYQIICETVDWLRGKGIDQWRKPLPREAYAARQGRGENFGLFVDGELAVILSLLNGVPEKYWRNEVAARDSLWLSTLATANKFRGRALGRQAVIQAATRQPGRNVYLDCKPGWLVQFYESLGFVALCQKRIDYAHQTPSDFEVTLLRWMECPETVRLRFRPITARDVDNLLAIFGDPVAMEFWPGTRTREEIISQIERYQQRYREHGYGLWAVELKETGALSGRGDPPGRPIRVETPAADEPTARPYQPTGEFIGRVGLIRQEQGIEVAYALVPRHWHRGYATEAAQASRDWVFEHLDCDRVISQVHTRNLPSCRVAERNGMRAVAEIMHWNLPHHVYAITRMEWEKQR